MGREFLGIFEEWAATYDETVYGSNEEYRAVFNRYPELLLEVSRRCKGHVLEFGAGTGNLTVLLLSNGHEVTAIDPSKPMREVAKNKLEGKAEVLDGDFLHYTLPETHIDTIASTFAFHHLTDEEKDQAFSQYSSLLEEGGKIVFADTAFRNDFEKNLAVEKAESQGYCTLANDLKTEYYTTLPVLEEMLSKYGFTAIFTQFNDFAWIIEATKINSRNGLE